MSLERAWVRQAPLGAARQRGFQGQNEAHERCIDGDKTLEIRDLRARIVDGDEILKGVDLVVPRGEVHALMGPNGSGKSTLAKIIAGDPQYEVTGGDILLEGESILEMEPDERARAGLYLAFQYPVEVPGVSIANFLRLALNARRPEGDEIGVMEFYEKLQKAVKELNWDESILERNLHEGFSGGEKKRSEILQLLVLEPRYAILDETDSGLVDALKVVSQGVNAARSPDFGALVITTQRCSTTSCPTRCTRWSITAWCAPAPELAMGSTRRVTSGSAKPSGRPMSNSPSSSTSQPQAGLERRTIKHWLYPWTSQLEGMRHTDQYNFKLAEVTIQV